MAYNLQPLIAILQQILDPQRTPLFVFRNNKPQVQSLLEKAVSLQQILKSSSLPKIEESLESQIRDAANKAEDMIESHVVDRMLSVPADVSIFVLTLDVQQAMQEFDYVMEQVVNLVDLERQKMPPMIGSSSSAVVSVSSSNKSVVVGVEKDLMQLKDRLVGMKSKLEIIPIVGMGGVGKTTLARKLYEDPLILSRFKYRAWTTISQDYSMREILLSLLYCIIGKDKETEDKNIEKGNDKVEDIETDKISEKGVDELKDILYRSLYGRRYMIVLDDIWSTKFWDEMRKYFPDNNNGSRIVITTRESNVAKHADSKSEQHEVQLLSNSESWNLLRQIVFGEEDCSDVLLEDIGRKIASDCGGLPLAITVIGGLLSKVDRSKDAWENIGNNVRAAIAESEEHEHFSNILSLSYNHLPNHLKPCFLYMGAFPEDYEVKASRLIRMWVAEGLIVKSSSNGGKFSFEEEAEDYLKALTERNLVMVRRNKSNGKPMSYSMHDLLRDVCMRKADEGFLHVNKGPGGVTFSNPRRVSVHVLSPERKDVYASIESMSLARSFICTGRLWDEIPFPEFLVLGLLRVLDVTDIHFRYFPEEIFQLVNLCYLAFFCKYLPAGISRLRNLQTLIAMFDYSPEIEEPSEIWKMSELRHLELNGFVLLIAKADLKDIVLVQKKLQVISWVKLTPSLIESGFFKRIPNIKKLSLYTRKSNAVNLGHLHKLEILRCRSNVDGSRFPHGLGFPSSLRKLSLVKHVIPPRVLTTLCALPNLEVLKINEGNFERDEWDMTAEGDEFRSLQFLHLESSGLVHWQADETNFPRLRRLSLCGCRSLQEIPSGFGEITTLQLIELEYCSESAVESAKQIEEVQQSDYDNYDLKLHIS